MEIKKIPWLLLTASLLFFLTNALASTPIASSSKGMVVTTQHLATKVGVDILNQGGNAIDAAVAVGYALAVVHPCCGNIGGGGFMLIYPKNKKPVVINFREKAPYAVNKIKNKQRFSSGILSVGVPGTVMGLNTALEKYGTLPLSQLIQPAINLAQNGFELNSQDKKFLNYAPKFFLKNIKHNKLIQKNLAHSLTIIKKMGTAGFYDGPISKSIINYSNHHGGILTKKDFDNYSVIEQLPIECSYKNYKIISAPPPSSGGIVLCQILHNLKKYPIDKYGFDSPKTGHVLIELMHKGFASRNRYLGDPEFVYNPTKKLINKKININLSKTDNSTKTPDVTPKLHTTHYSIIDKQGNAVSVTYTINSFFGSKIIAGNTGFFLNNELDDFTLDQSSPNKFGLLQGKPNLIQPGKRPLSSMSPTIVLKNNKLFLILGTPGGSTIITSVLNTVLNIIDFGMGLNQAVTAPRLHAQGYPNKVFIEPNRFSDKQVNILKNKGHQIQSGLYGRKQWGAVEAILIDPRDNIRYGFNDPRRPGGLAFGN